MKQLCELVAQILRVDTSMVNPESGPLALPQWDSFHHVHIVVAIEETYGLWLSRDEIFGLLTREGRNRPGLCRRHSPFYQI